MKRFVGLVLIICIFCGSSLTITAEGSDKELEKIEVENRNEVYVSNLISKDVYIDNSFGNIQCVVDAQIYNGMLQVCNEETLREVYGNKNTEMFYYACEVINPCMAFATSKGEAGPRTSEPGVSLTTVIATNSRYYTYEVDWVQVTSELSQVDELWYLSNCNENCSVNVNNKSAYMPTSYLQNGGSDGLGIGPYQITTSNWDAYTLEDRMSPIKGWKASLKKTGTYWLDCGITPTSDITVMALLSMSHQGGSIITSDVGAEIANNINREDVQSVMKQCAYDMYVELLTEVQSGNLVCADDINVTPYVQRVYDETGVDFSQWSYGSNSTNTGNYVMAHTLQYIFYKYYFGLEV